MIYSSLKECHTLQLWYLDLMKHVLTQLSDSTFMALLVDAMIRGELKNREE